MGYLTAGEDAGSVVAPLLASLLWTGFGVPAALLGRVVLALVTEVYAFCVTHRTRDAHSPETPRTAAALEEPEEEVPVS
jgi:hypothetical protein